MSMYRGSAKPLTATLALAAGLAIAGPAAAQVAYHLGNSGEPTSVDPHKISGTWENRPTGDMFLGLVTEAADASEIPGAAESWAISADGRTYTFKLRSGATWSDGQPVTAEDFVFSLRRILDPATAAKYASLLYPILNAQEFNKGAEKDPAKLGVRAIDKATLEITLKAPTPYFLSQLTHYTAWPVPKHVVEAKGNDWVKPGNFVSNGPYTLAEWVPNTHMKVTKNPRFYDAANVKIDQVFYYPTEDRSAALRRFRARELDANTDFASDQYEFLKKELPNETKVSAYLGIFYYAFNVTRPPFNDVRVRNALSMVINREAVTDQVLKTGEVPAYSFVPPGTGNYGTPAYVSWKDKPYAERVAEAKKLMAEAGFGPNNPLKFQFKYNTSENNKRIAIATAAMWKQALGVEADLHNAEVKVHYDDLQKRDFQGARAGWIADYNDAQNFLYLLQTSTGAHNYSGWSNAAYDKLMDDASVTADLGTRAEMMRKAESIAMAEQPYFPIYYYVSKNLVHQHVKGWVPNTKDIHRTRWLSIQK